MQSENAEVSLSISTTEQPTAIFQAAKRIRRLCLFFDGTWNEPGDHTNVFRLSLMLASTSADGAQQVLYYDEGVGTHQFDSVTGGLFGAGLSENVRKGYKWLMENYDPGDEIYLFGFSRGAFTARSLAGVISRCGLLQPEAPISFTQLYDRYRRGDKARPIYELIREKANANSFELEDKLLLRYTHYRRNLMKMVGVWDTVGSLGIPLGRLPVISSHAQDFHYTNLSRTVEHAYQALAIDEHRLPFNAILWKHFIPEAQPAQPPALDNRTPDNCTVEQRWFAGAHSNVGGGYRSDLLPQRSLKWMQDKAIACGLAFRRVVRLDDDDLLMPLRDSYGEFLKGAWRVASLGRRFVRTLHADTLAIPAREVNGRPRQAGRLVTANERIDASVFRRCQINAKYRPPALLEWAQRKGLTLDALIEDPQQHLAFDQHIIGPGIETNELA